MTLWLKAREWLLPALKMGGKSEAELLADLATCKAQVWIGERSAFVTHLISDGEGSSIHVWLAGGSLKELLRMRPGIEAWARGLGCRFASIDGRPGWTRVLGPEGYTMAGKELRKTL